MTFQYRGRITIDVTEVIAPMDVELVYFDDCPNWRLARERLDEALKALGRTDVEVRLHRVASPAEAQTAGLHGSPTVLVDGEDPFPHAAIDAWSCRLYQNEGGLDGAPSVSGLMKVLD